MLTPTFSKTRPRMTAMVPPPPPARCHGVRSNRPARACLRPLRRQIRPRSPRTRAQMRSRSAANQAAARSQRSGSGGKVAASCSWLRQQPGLAQRFGERDRAGEGDVERSRRRMQGDHDSRLGGAGAPPAAPRRFRGRAGSCRRAQTRSGGAATWPEVVISTSRDCGSRAARNAAHEPCRATRQRAA